MTLSKTRRLCLNTSSVWGLGPPPWAPLELKTAEDSPTPTNSSDFVACVFNWNHGGHEVFVTGSFNDWSTSEKVKLTKMGGAFTAVEELPMGRHLYKFIVDGAWRYDPQLPLAEDGNGNVNNVIDLEDYVPYDFSMPDAFQEAHQATFFQEIPELSSYTYDAPQMPSVLTTGVCAATDPPPRSNLPYLALGTHLFFDSHAPVLFGARIYSSANTHRWRATPTESTGGQKSVSFSGYYSMLMMLLSFIFPRHCTTVFVTENPMFAGTDCRVASDLEPFLPNRSLFPRCKDS